MKTFRPPGPSRANEAARPAPAHRAPQETRPGASGLQPVGATLSLEQRLSRSRLLGFSAPQVVPRPAPAVQRKVGFEFEVGNVITHSGRASANLEKKDVLLRGDGFTAEADLQTGGFSDLEFVTSPVEENADGEERLGTVLGTIQTLVRTAARLGGEDRENRKGTVAASQLAEFGVPTPQRYMDTATTWGAQIQATAGLKLGSLDRVLGDLAGPGEEAERRPERRERGGGSERDEREPRDERSLLLLDEPPRENAVPDFPADPQVGGIRAAAQGVISQLFRRVSPELVGLVTLLALYLDRGAQGTPLYGKTISGPLMARTDFATIFSLLPRPLKVYFKLHPDEFVALVSLVAQRGGGSGANFAEGDPVFSGGLYTLNERLRDEAPDVSALTIGAWLRGLVGPPPSDLPSFLLRFFGEPRGVDLLTAEHFPGGRRQQDEVESLGGYGSKVDRIGASPLFGAGAAAPIFEFRALSNLYPDGWTEFALAMLRYVRAVNRGGGATASRPPIQRL